MKSINETFEYCKTIKNELMSYYTGEVMTDDNEQASLFDYIAENVLDTEYILDSSFRLIGVKLYVTLGGPTAWIDTRTKTIVTHWGTDSSSLYIDSDVCDEINDYFAECLPQFDR